ncbi:MAG TPA: hypothetical protein VIF15_17155 [Polyangiaceae bacterium]|jgi:hypothetical protein
MLKGLAFSVGWGLVLSACALDAHGLGSDVGSGPGSAVTDADGAPVQPDAELADATAADEASEAATVDGTSEASGAQDASTGDAPVTDAPAEAGVVCDQDGDGHLAAGSICGGDDCCDSDAEVHPGQTSYFATQSACGGFDYDCDGKLSPQFGPVSCQWSTFSCSGDGFAAPVPVCGAFGTFSSCVLPWYNAFSCAASTGQQAQACR